MGVILTHFFHFDRKEVEGKNHNIVFTFDESNKFSGSTSPCWIAPSENSNTDDDDDDDSKTAACPVSCLAT
jgi:hypothetical protein